MEATLKEKLNPGIVNGNVVVQFRDFRFPCRILPALMVGPYENLTFIHSWTAYATREQFNNMLLMYKQRVSRKMLEITDPSAG